MRVKEEEKSETSIEKKLYTYGGDNLCNELFFIRSRWQE